MAFSARAALHARRSIWCFQLPWPCPPCPSCGSSPLWPRGRLLRQARNSVSSAGADLPAPPQRRNLKAGALMLLPFISSVAMELVAMAAPQPKVLKPTSSMMPSSFTLRNICIMSPHLALPTMPTPFASSNAPTLRGCSKWSRTFSVYLSIFSPSVFAYFSLWG